MHYKITLLDRNRCYKTSYNDVTVNKVPGLLYWGVCNAEPTGSVPLKAALQHVVRQKKGRLMH